MIVFAFFVFYAPNILGHADNYIEANPMVTPAHIVPEWYLLPFYAILRSVPDKLLGVVAMLSACLVGSEMCIRDSTCTHCSRMVSVTFLCNIKISS